MSVSLWERKFDVDAPRLFVQLNFFRQNKTYRGAALRHQKKTNQEFVAILNQEVRDENGDYLRRKNSHRQQPMEKMILSLQIQKIREMVSTSMSLSYY